MDRSCAALLRVFYDTKTLKQIDDILQGTKRKDCPNVNIATLRVSYVMIMRIMHGVIIVV